MARVIEIFEYKFLCKKLLPIVRPGTQSRRLTYLDDAINFCFRDWKSNKYKYYSISNKKNLQNIEFA